MDNREIKSTQQKDHCKPLQNFEKWPSNERSGSFSIGRETCRRVTITKT